MAVGLKLYDVPWKSFGGTSCNLLRSPYVHRLFFVYGQVGNHEVRE